MSFLTPKIRRPDATVQKKPPIETETIRNPRNRVGAGRRPGTNIQSIMSAGLAGGSGGQQRLAGGV